MDQDELFDVVDSTDTVIGQATRAEVHRRGLRHRAAHIVVYDLSGRVYLQQRALWKDCSPGLWDTSAAGHLESGESYQEGAARELTEELGIRPTELTRLFKITAQTFTGYEFITVFKTLTDEVIRPDPNEIITGKWCAPAAIEHWIDTEPETLTGVFRLLWSMLKAETVKHGS